MRSYFFQKSWLNLFYCSAVIAVALIVCSCNGGGPVKTDSSSGPALSRKVEFHDLDLDGHPDRIDCSDFTTISSQGGDTLSEVFTICEVETIFDNLKDQGDVVVSVNPNITAVTLSGSNGTTYTLKETRNSQNKPSLVVCVASSDQSCYDAFGIFNEVSYGYDSSGNVTSIRARYDGYAYRAAYTFDNKNNLTSFNYNYGTDETTGTETYTHDTNHNMISLSYDVYGNEADYLKTMSYDAHHHLITGVMTDKTGVTNQVSYSIQVYDDGSTGAFIDEDGNHFPDGVKILP